MRNGSRYSEQCMARGDKEFLFECSTTLTRDLPSSNEHQEIKSEKQENKNKNDWWSLWALMFSSFPVEIFLQRKVVRRCHELTYRTVVLNRKGALEFFVSLFVPFSPQLAV